MKNKIILCIIILLIIICLVIFINRPKNYSLKYNLDGFEILENYYKESNTYYFKAEIGDKYFEISVNSKYQYTKHLINKIKIIDEDELYCLYMQSDKIKTFPTCISNDKRIFYVSLDRSDKDFYQESGYDKFEEKFENVEIFSLKNKNIAVWNHYGFDLIINDKIQKTTLLKKESYLDNYSFIIDKYIILPNYDQEYTFNKVYIIDMETGKNTIWNLNYNINYDFYILGIKNNKIYFVDKKEKVEYELEPNKRIITIISKNGVGKIWNDKWEEESIIKIANNDYSIKDSHAAYYKLDNSILTVRFNEEGKEHIVTDKKVDKIITSDNNGIYYLYKNEIYYFSPFKGEVKFLKYNELEFNKGLTVYIY